MARIQLHQLETLRSKDQATYEVIKKMAEAIDHLSTQTNSNPNGPLQTPTSPDKISVTAADGIFDVAITDNTNQSRGLNYFVEYSPTPGFESPVTLALGPARNDRRQLGNITLYWRAYSQLVGSDPSAYVYFGNPTPVTGGGALAGPTPQAGSGSGPTGSQGGGFGNADYRNAAISGQSRPSGL